MTRASLPHSADTPHATDGAGSGGLIAAFSLFLGGYVVLLGWFKLVDVYHAHFSATGVLLFGQTLFRTLFIFYLVWIAVGAGTLLVRSEKWRRTSPHDAAEFLLLTFFAGVGLLHVAVFALGFASLLNSTTMIILTVPLVALSFPRACTAARALRDALHAGNWVCSTGWLLIGVAWFGLLVVKGLYPGGGQDYYVHYFPAYRAFVEHGSLWPNEWWWDYFYVKGAGLFFLGMLLTDPLAPQTVIFCTSSVAGVVVFLLTRRLAPRTAWPMAATLLFFAIMIYTPGWGEFGKLHEFDTIFVIGIVWMTAALLEVDATQARPWLIAVASAQIAAILVNLAIAAFLAMSFIVLALLRLCLRDRRGCLLCLGQAGIATALVVVIMLINYATTGLPSDLALPYAAKFADVEKLYRSGALPMLILVSRVFSFTGVPVSKSLNFLQFVLRGNLLWPLLAGGFFVLAAAWIGRLARKSKGKPAVSELRQPAVIHVIAAALVSLAILTVTVGRGISPSYYRFTTFALPLVIVAGIAMWTAPLRVASSSRLAALIRHPGAPTAIVALCAAAVIHATHVERVAFPLFGNALRHALGLLSIDAAFQHQSGGMAAMPSRDQARAAVASNIAYRDHDPLAGTYPGARGAYAAVGPKTPILSLHANSYCMLPDCRILSYPYVVMTPTWDRVLWGSAEEARSLLRRGGIDYVLFSRELPLQNPLVLSQLFAPDQIGNYFGIRWTDGITTLLTWSGPDTKPLDAAWIDEYRQSIATSPYRRVFSEARAIFAGLDATPHPWHAIALPLLGDK